MNAVLLIGSTGRFGTQIARALIRIGSTPRLLVRDGSQANLAADLAATCDVTTDADTAYQGIDTVISAIQGGPDTIIDAQLDQLARARNAGVRRYLPSDFSLNFFELRDGENINSDWRREFAQRADQQRADTEVVHVMQGCFLDEHVLFGFLGSFDLNQRTAQLWGDGLAKMQFTTCVDTADFVAAAATDSRPLPQRLFFAGASLNFWELVDEISAGLGMPMSVDERGTLDDLDDQIARQRDEQPENALAWLALMYWRAMLSGRGQLAEAHNNRYPTIKPIGVQEYVRTLEPA